MFGTYERFNLIRAAYARNGASLYLFEDYFIPGRLRLGSNFSGDMISTTDFLFDLKLTVNGVAVPYSYFADEASVRLYSGEASAEIAITNRAHLRIRGVNAGLRLELRAASENGPPARACRGLFPLPDGSGWEADFAKYGKLFFKSLAGAFYADSSCDSDGIFQAFSVDFLPATESAVFEAAIHEYTESIHPFGTYEPFDDTLSINRQDFLDFCAFYPLVPQEYRDTAKYALWTIWSHRTAASGAFTEPVILFQVAWVVSAASWQQSYNAMPMLRSPAEAWRQICTMFNYQDERTGRLPSMITYAKAKGATGMQPPFQGFALDFIIRQIGDSFLTPSECERMYPKFAKWTEYWTTYRNAGFGDDVTAIKSPHESGWDDSSNFKDGFPASEPNTLAFLVLLMESTARLARGCGKDTEADTWLSRADKLTQTIITDFWNGEQFVTKVKGKVVESKSLSAYQPIILGKRLPQEIIDKVAEKLMREGEWLTDIGLASESMSSDLVTFGVSFVCGRVAAPQNMIMSVGLQAAGKLEEAQIVARRFCDNVKREGVILGFAPYDYYPLTGQKADEQIPPQPADGWPWSSWCANSFMTMASSIL